MSKFFAWLVYSTKDPAKVGLSAKGFLGSLLIFLTYAAGVGHIQLPTDQLTTLVDLVVQWVQLGAGLVSLTALVYGSVRKVWATIAGSHPLLSQ